jgi:enoyl-CoA hydratase
MSAAIDVTIERRVAVCRIVRERDRNALGPDLAEELIAALEDLDADPGVGAIVITGSGDYFATGPDIRSYAGPRPGPPSDLNLAPFWQRQRAIGKPLIAAVTGWALSSGCELALACDLVVVAKDATFGLPEITFGVIPSGGATQRLTRAIGKHRAMELVLTGRRMTGRQAHEWGLANVVMDRRGTLEQAVMLAEELAGRPPLALRYAKQAIQEADELGLADGLERERLLFNAALDSEDRAEGVAALLEGRRAEFGGK